MTRSRSQQSRAAAGAVLALALTLTAGCSSITVRKEMHEANALYKAEKYEEAVTHYKRVIEADSTHIEAWLNMGYAYRALFHPGSTHEKDVEYARAGIDAFRKVIELDPRNEKAQQYFLDFCTVAERYDEAIGYFESELKTSPNDAQLIRQIASLYGKKGDADNALKYFKRWTEVEPSDPVAWYTIGVACWERSYRHKTMISVEEREAVITQGIAALDKALKIKPDYFDALSYMNLIYREKADLEANRGKNAVAGADFETAQTYMKKALEVRNAQMKAQAAGG